MDTLRWILLVIGALFIVGVYIWSRRGNGDREDVYTRAEPGIGHPDHDTDDPLFAPLPKATARPTAAAPVRADDADPDLDAMHRELSSLQELLQVDAAEQVATEVPQPAPVQVVPAEQKVIAVYAVAPAGELFSGEAVIESLQALGLRYADDMQIYHYYPATGEEPVFGVANLVEPGTLEPDQLREAGTHGLTLFLQLPGPLNPLQAFDLFVDTAQQLAERLQGELRDRHRNLLSRQILEHLRDDVQQYARRQRIPRQA